MSDSQKVREGEPEEKAESSRAPTPEEIRDNVAQIANRGKEVMLGPVWETARLYGRGLSEGINTLFEGITGKKKNND